MIARPFKNGSSGAPKIAGGMLVVGDTMSTLGRTTRIGKNGSSRESVISQIYFLFSVDMFAFCRHVCLRGDSNHDHLVVHVDMARERLDGRGGHRSLVEICLFCPYRLLVLADDCE